MNSEAEIIEEELVYGARRRELMLLIVTEN